MKRIINSAIALVMSAALLVACATREQSGAVIGGTVGAMVGSGFGMGGGHGPMGGHHGGGGGNLALIVLGAAAGGLIGAMIGREMDDQDRLHTAQVLEYNKTGQASTWTNPDKNTAYTVEPTRTFESGTGPCREFTTRANIGGKLQEVYGTACRQADGSWKVVK
jgi:surface antigen